jgi:hypothetical protein
MLIFFGREGDYGGESFEMIEGESPNTGAR